MKNKKQFTQGLLLGVLVLLVVAWTVTSGVLNSNQFFTTGNRAGIKNGALTTNQNIRGLTVPAGGITNAGIFTNGGAATIAGPVTNLSTTRMVGEVTTDGDFTVGNELSVASSSSLGSVSATTLSVSGASSVAALTSSGSITGQAFHASGTTAPGKISLGTNNNFVTLAASSDGGMLLINTNHVIVNGTNGAMTLSTNLLLPLGSAARPALSWARDDDGSGTGFYSDQANQIDMTLNGAQSFHFDNAVFRIINSTATIRLGDTYLVQDFPELQLGNDAATAGHQIFKGPDGTGANGTGGALTIAGGRGAGTGRGGAVVLATSRVLGTGSTAQTNAPRHHIEPKAVTLTESSATTVANVAVGAARYVGIRLMATTFASDATDHQIVSETLSISAVNKAGTVTTTVGLPYPASTNVSSGTLTTTWTAVANGNSIDIKNSAVSSLTQTTLHTDWRIEIDSNEATGITPQ